MSGNNQLHTALQQLNILIVPKNIAVYNKENQIVELYLSRYVIKSIPENFFQNPIFENVEKLHLNSNKINFLHERTFQYLKKLQFLNFSRNYLQKVEKGLFRNLNNLLELDLSNNKLTDFEESSFDDLTSLKTIILKNNYLEELPANLFEKTLNVTQLDLSINKFRNVPKAISKIHSKKVNFFDLKGNYIPNEFAKTFITSPVIHSFISEVREFWNSNVVEISIPNLDVIIKQYLFNSLMSVYHYAVNVPVLNYSLLGITLGYMTKNFHLLTNYIGSTIDLSFRQNLQLWQICLENFKPIENALMKILETNEEMNVRQRKTIENGEFTELGELIDYKFKKTDIHELIPVHENFFTLIKQFLSWNNPHYSTIFL